MKKRKKTFLFGLAILGIAFAFNPAQAQMATGEVLVNTCYSCHGTDGKSVGDMPTVAGKSKNFISKKLKDFKSGKKSSTVMMRITKGFSDSELDAIAAIMAKK
ncbi:MAG: cytochrome C [Rhodospirillaceae bacterium]|nr:cytochrome C [Rhodospirillaceae bacterium]MBT4587977.1 cytochrome C [Rhodospirillaceae bacterium]MBT5938498.1 cytochrome C [Rhodospirillaceae bacterium]MBT7268660.1 cytochrome C [Rhodospirillaceae bacterium]